MSRNGIIVRVDSTALRSARQTALLTQKELADKVGMTSLQISRIENGVQNSTAHNLRKVAEVLGVDLDLLIFKSE